ncbi:MAG: hypothetical protein KAS29_00785 [Bacteroidales bacterium]|nr:hypothetical protein [Bacteroidales bacterium]
MLKYFICLHCGKNMQRNPRSKHQQYCSSHACQNARKRKHDSETASTPKGKILKQRRNKRWREKNKTGGYQKRYREEHSEYEEQNRKQQSERNKKRRDEQGPMIVKTDALLLQPSDDGVYMAFKIKKQKIVKTDTLLLQVQAQSAIEAHFPPNTG